MEDIELEEEICAVTKGHCVITNWIPVVGTAREKKYCYNCHREMADRATPFTIFAINMEQTAQQTAIRSDKATGTTKFYTTNKAKIVIPTSAEYNMIAIGIGVTMTGNFDQTICGNTVYYSVDGGASWAPCPGEEGILTIALVSEMFTGENADNVELALANGIKFGVIPGYNAEYVEEHPDNLAKTVRTVIEIDKSLLSNDPADAAGHKNDPALKVTLCEHVGSREVETAVDGDYTTYTFKCTECDKVLGTSAKIKNRDNSVKFYNPGFISNSAIVGVQNGVVFTRINPTGGNKITVTPISGTIGLGRYVVIKYRAMGYGSIKAVWGYSGASKNVTHTISRAETDGWQIAVINVTSMYANGVYREGGTGGFTLNFECEGVVDIAYVAMTTGLDEIHDMMNEGETYHNRGNSFSKVGALCDINGNCIIHSTVSTKVVDEANKKTTYSYTCEICENKLCPDIVVPDSITYFVDMTKITASDGNGNTQVAFLGDGTVAYARSTLTTSAAASILMPTGEFTMGRYMMIKYRASGDGYVRFYPCLSGKNNDDKGSSAHPKDVWMVAVIDLSEHPGYREDGTGAFYFKFDHTCTLDIAYVAVSDDIAALRSLLGDEETYFYRGSGVNSFKNIADQVEISKEGTCKHGCTPTYVPAIQATCTTPGRTAGSACSACGTEFIKTVEIPVDENGHVEIGIPAVDATCSTVGYTAGSKCAKCGDILTNPTEIPANNHHVEEEIPAVSATCSSTGLSAGVKCALCSTIIVAPQATEKDEDNHVLEITPAVAPTCSSAGYTEGSKCLECGEVFATPQEVIDNNAHNIEIGVAASVGYTTYSYKCTVCDTKVANDVVVPTSVVFFADISKIVPQGADSKVTLKSDNGIAYASAEWLGTGERGSILMNESGEHGKYLVVKYRIHSEEDTGYIRLQPYLNGQRNSYGSTRDEAANKWIIAVVDISKLNGYDKSQSNYLCFWHETTLDIAFIAMADDLAAIRELLGEDESYYWRGDSTTNAFNNVKKQDATETLPALPGQIEVKKNTICASGNAVEGHTIVEIPAIPATCLATGLTAGEYCPACGVITKAQEETPIVDHNLVNVPAILGTCTTDGYSEGVKCEWCEYACEGTVEGIIKPTNTGKVADNHVYVDIPEVEADCSTPASGAGTICTECGEYGVEPVVGEKDPDKHVYEIIPAKDATCIENGYTAGLICTKCGCLSDGGPTIVEANEAYHVVKVTVSTNGNKTVYAYTCAKCGIQLRKNTEISSDIIYFTDITNITLKPNEAGNTSASISYRFEDGVAFVRVSSPLVGGSQAVTLLPVVGETTYGKYVAVKYRVSEGGNLRFRPMFGSSDNNVGSSSKDHSSEWSIAIIDISQLNGYSTTAASQLYWMFYSRGELDIAYVAMSDSIEALRGLLEDEETYFFRPGTDATAFNNIAGQIELDKNGACIGEHVNANANCQTTVECEVCGQQFTGKHALTEATCKEQSHCTFEGCDYVGEYAEHTLVYVPAVEGTCHSDGYTDGYMCKWCEYAGEGTIEGVREPVNTGKVADNHKIIMKKTYDAAAGTYTYTYGCGCDNAEFKYQSVTLPENAFAADITGITSTSGTVSQNIDNGKIYTHIAVGEGQTTTVISMSDVKIGMALFMKYRLNGNDVPHQNIEVTISYVANGIAVQLSSTASAEALQTYHQGWVVGRVNMYSSFNSHATAKNWIKSGFGTRYFEDIADSLTITIKHSEDLDIEFLYGDSHEDNKHVFPAMYAQGDKYYIVQNNFGIHDTTKPDRWREIPATGTTATTVSDNTLGEYRTPYLKDADASIEPGEPGEPDEPDEPDTPTEPTDQHNILFRKEVGATHTTYTYYCECTECNGKVLSTRTAANEVFVLDITQYTTGELVYDEETGRVYRHFEANGQTTTTITIENVPYGVVMFVKYRLNGDEAPTKDFATSVKYGGLEDRHETLKGLVASGTATVADLATYHQGWVVGRLNCLGNLRNHGILNSQQTSVPETAGMAQSITITFVHYEDLDLEFFITDDGEDNAGAFQTLYETGDKYYLVTASAVLGTHSGTNRWREIPATGTSPATINDSALNGYKTPYLRDAAASAVASRSLIAWVPEGLISHRKVRI